MKEFYAKHIYETRNDTPNFRPVFHEVDEVMAHKMGCQLTRLGVRSDCARAYIDRLNKKEECCSTNRRWGYFATSYEDINDL